MQDLKDIKALTLDTGGTILDWHTGFSSVLSALGEKHQLDHDWTTITNEFRRESLGKMVNLGEHEPPAYNFDGAHQSALDEVLASHGISVFTPEERRLVWWDTPHGLKCWPDFPPAIPRLRSKYICASFTLLSVRLIVDTARRNNLSWDAVISCEMIGKYKILPEAYLTAAKLLQFDPGEICMVACHNFDLDAARAAGFRTAFVRRPLEWGPAGPPDPDPNPACDLVVDTFFELADRLGC
ncbi:MAG: HAD family hydrolase [Burkholderiaceae bacterium]